MQYGPTGRSLGSATVFFHKADQAAKAVKALDNIRIDNRLVRVEVLVSARDAPLPTPSSLADRVSYVLVTQIQQDDKTDIPLRQPKKDKPKPATATKSKAEAGARGRGAKRGRGGKAGAPREKKKTVEELDAEMADYFPAGEGGNDGMVTNGGDAAQGPGGDTAMDDEVL